MLTGNGGRGVYFPARGFKVLGHKYQNADGSDICGVGANDSSNTWDCVKQVLLEAGAPCAVQIAMAGELCLFCLGIALVNCDADPLGCIPGVWACNAVCSNALLACLADLAATILIKIGECFTKLA